MDLLAITVSSNRYIERLNLSHYPSRSKTRQPRLVLSCLVRLVSERVKERPVLFSRVPQQTELLDFVRNY
jgi:hypothetical protein